jgi:Flp pilus assembly protein TadG
MNFRRQSGLAAVEFAVVGATALVILFGCIEVGRTLFVWNAVGEATRRGARVAIVTASADAARAAVLAYSPSVMKALTTSNVDVTYCNEAGSTCGGAPAADTMFVTVSIQDYTHALMIPGLKLNLSVPAFSTTLPAESLGFDPD